MLTIESPNLSVAWGRAFLASIARGTRRIEPLIVSVTAFAHDGRPLEDLRVSEALDISLKAAGATASIRTVANTIFPDRWWRPGTPREKLFERYHSVLSRLHRCPPNRHGLYFERLISFNGPDPARSNQLKFILDSYSAGRHAISSLQAAVFDPMRDLTRSARRGFPCLQHVTFAPDGPAGTLTVTGFYASQYVFEKAYGNYLGLCLLGRFMAAEMGLRLVKMNCIAAQARMSGEVSKESLEGLGETVATALQPLQ